MILSVKNKATAALKLCNNLKGVSNIITNRLLLRKVCGNGGVKNAMTFFFGLQAVCSAQLWMGEKQNLLLFNKMHIFVKMNKHKVTGK